MSVTDKTSPAVAPETAAAAVPTIPNAVSEAAAPASATKMPAKKVARKSAAERGLPARPGNRASTRAVPKAAAVKAEAKAVLAPTAKPKSDKLLKAKKLKLVRDSFTIPKLEYLILEELKQRGGKLGSPVKKSELIRAGVKALAAMSDANFLATLKAVPTIKTGRPLKD